MLKHEDFQFQIYKNPKVKCSVIEIAYRMIRDKFYKYFTYKNSYRYIDVLPKFVKAYTDTVYYTTGMAPSKVTDSDIPAIWNRMNNKSCHFRTVKAKFGVG